MCKQLDSRIHHGTFRRVDADGQADGTGDVSGRTSTAASLKLSAIDLASCETWILRLCVGNVDDNDQELQLKQDR